MAGNKTEIDDKGRRMVRCEACFSNGGKLAHFHVLDSHINSAHGLTRKKYIDAFPEAELMSDHAKETMIKAREARAKGRATLAVVGVDPASPPEPEPLQFGVASLYVRDKDALSPECQIKIPNHDEHFELDEFKLEAFALGIQHGDNILIVGPTGSGKTSFVEELAAILNQPVETINLNGDTRVADFVGEKTVEVDPTSGQAITGWSDGICPKAMRFGRWLELDEVDAAPAQILFTLQSVIDHRRRLVLTGNGGEVVRPDPDFRVIATANTLGRGDDSGLYAGTRILNEAFLDRFGTVIEWDYPQPDKEAEILVKKSEIPLEQARKMVECAIFVRKGFANEDCDTTFSTRRLIKWAQKTVAFSRSKSSEPAHWRAAQLSVFNKLSGDNRVFVQDIVKRVMGK